VVISCKKTLSQKNEERKEGKVESKMRGRRTKGGKRRMKNERRVKEEVKKG
jgi:hypothetical protein